MVENGRVAGVQVHGEVRRAPLVVAADGAHSRFRHRLHLNVPVPRSRIGARRHYRLAAGRTAEPWVDIFLGPGHEFYVTPLPSGEVLVALLAEAAAVSPPLEPIFDCWRAAPPRLRQLLEGAEPVSDLLATPLAARARAGYVPGAVSARRRGRLSRIPSPAAASRRRSSRRSGWRLHRRPSRRGSRHLVVGVDRERQALLRDYRLLTRGVLGLARRPMLARAALATLSHLPSLFSHLVGVSAGTRSLTPPFRTALT